MSTVLDFDDVECATPHIRQLVLRAEDAVDPDEQFDEEDEELEADEFEDDEELEEDDFEDAEEDEELEEEEDDMEEDEEFDDDVDDVA